MAALWSFPTLIALLSLAHCGTAINYTHFIEADGISGRYTSTCLLSATRELFGEHSMVTIVNCNVRHEPGFTAMSASVEYLLQNGVESKNLFSVTTGDTLDFVPYKHHPQGQSHTDHYLVFIEQPEHFHATFRKLSRMPDYNISASFFLVVTRRVASSAGVASHILRMAYQYGKYLVKVLVPAQADVFELYAYNLYTPSSVYCAAEPQVELVNTCTRGAFEASLFTVAHDPTGLNCTLRVLAMRVPPFVISRQSGLEMQILHEIGRRMNVSYEIELNARAEYWGDRLANGSWTGMLQKVFADPLSVGVGALSLTHDRMADFDYSLDYYAQKMVWVVPAARRVPQVQLLWMAFTWHTWLLLVASMCIVGVLLHQVSRIERGQQQQGFAVALMTAFQVAITSGVPRLPIGGAARILLVSYSIAAICMASLYQTKRFSLLAQPPFERPIHTYDEVLASAMPIGGLRTYKEIFNQPDQRSLAVFRRYLTVDRRNDTLHYWLLRVVRDRRTITILGKFYTQYHMITHEQVMDEDGEPNVHIVNELIYVDTIRMIFAKGFPLKRHMDALIASLVSSGLVEYWKQSYLNVHHMRTSAGEDEGTEPTTASDQEVILTLAHLRGSFLLLLIGSGLAAVVFLAELGRSYAGHARQGNGPTI